jgi:hypothetical protein
MASVPLCGLPGFSFRVSVLPTSVNELVTNLVKVDSEAFSNSTWQLGIADGRLRVIDNHKRYPALFPQVEQLVNSLHGELIVEESIGVDLSAKLPTNTPLMGRVKQQLDPNGTFSF